MIPLWLLGLGPKILAFARANWKLLLIIAAAVFVYFYVQDLKRDAYKRGKAECNAAWQKRVQDENTKNREYEKKLQQQLDEFGKRFEKQQQDRIEKETTHTNTIREIVKEKPIYTQCKVDQRVLDERNKIRAMGPKQ